MPATSTAYDIIASHGRGAYLRGEAYKPSASEAWQAGWIAEAHLASRAAQAESLAQAMRLVDAYEALVAAGTVLDICRPNKPTRTQARALHEAAPKVRDALDRLAAVLDPPGDTTSDEAAA
jgi:hypothetical protein